MVVYFSIASSTVCQVCAVSEASLRNDGFCLHAALWSLGSKRVAAVSGFAGTSRGAVRAKGPQTGRHH